MTIQLNKLTNHIPPKLHPDITKMSLENYWKIKNSYKEIVGLHQIDHFSVSIVDPNYLMSIISYTPSIIYNAYAEGWYVHNGSLSRTFYEVLDMFVWDQCYDKKYFNKIKFLVEQRYGLNIGISLVRKINGFHIIYCFGTKGDKNILLNNITENKNLFLKMGDHCYNLIKNIYTEYTNNHEAPEIPKIQKIIK